MPAILTQLISFALSVFTSFTMLFTPVTDVINLTNFAYATSFGQIEYTEDRLAPEKDADGWIFNTDRPLKVVQLTDVHIGGGLLSKSFDRNALNAVAAMLKYEKPDLVVLTGDMVYPVPFQGGTLNNKVSTNLLITLLETLGVYYAPIFGNHDTESYSTYTRDQIGDVWSADNLKYSLFNKGPEDVDGTGNYIIKVKNSNGIVNNALFCIDSNAYTDGSILGIDGNYDNIHENQIEWYKAKIKEIDAANKAVDASCPMFSSLVFIHIPLEEYGIAWEEYKANGNTENVTYITGEHRERTCSSPNPDNFFETVQELGSTKAIFCGHDHVNNGIIEYKGVKLVYGMSIDYIAYVDPITSLVGYQRGCTVITVEPDGEIEVSLENYYQDKYDSKYFKEIVSMK